jgi:hypothetical protein
MPNNNAIAGLAKGVRQKAMHIIKMALLAFELIFSKRPLVLVNGCCPCIVGIWAKIIHLHSTFLS